MSDNQEEYTAELIDKQKAYKLIDEIKQYESEISTLKQKIQLRSSVMRDHFKPYEDLFKLRFSQNEYKWNGDMNLLVRWMCRTTVKVNLPSQRYSNFFMTRTHGLKYPRQWSGTPIFPTIGARFYKLDENHKLWNGSETDFYVDFAPAINNSRIDQNKLKEYFKFITRFETMNGIIKSLNYSKVSKLTEIAKLLERGTNWWDIQQVERMYELEGEMKTSLEEFKGDVERAVSCIKSFEDDLHSYLSPYRVLMKIKD